VTWVLQRLRPCS